MMDKKELSTMELDHVSGGNAWDDIGDFFKDAANEIADVFKDAADSWADLFDSL